MQEPGIWHVVRVRRASGKKLIYIKVPHSNITGTYWLCVNGSRKLDAMRWADIKGIYFRDLGNLFDPKHLDFRKTILKLGAANGRL